MTPPGLATAICTRNRPQQLARALASLVRQVPAPGEILVIDNAPSDDATRRLVETSFPSVRYLLEPRPGLDVARNRALRESGQAVVAFLDDDAVAEPGWCRGIVEAFTRDPQAAVCTTRVEAFSLETPAQRLFEANGGFARGMRRVRLPAEAGRWLHQFPVPLIAWAISIGNGVGFAVRRDVALRLGGFDEALDRGAPLPGGGDLDMFWRALTDGSTLVYEPEALTLHEHRREMHQVREQILSHQCALVAFLCKSLGTTRGTRRLGVAVFLAWRLVKPGVRLMQRLIRPRLVAGCLALGHVGADAARPLGVPGAGARIRCYLPRHALKSAQ